MSDVGVKTGLTSEQREEAKEVIRDSYKRNQPQQEFYSETLKVAREAKTNQSK